MNNLEDNTSTLENIITSSIASIPISLAGFAYSFLDPMFIPRVVRRTLRTKENLLPHYIISTAAITGYMIGIGLIASNISKNPSNPFNYIPLATNIIGGIYLDRYMENKKSY